MTEGKWQIGFKDGSGSNPEGCYIVSTGMFGLDTVVVRGGSPEGDVYYGVQHPDDARLIVAAPDLLDALKELAREEFRDDDDPILNVARSKARATIAKAEGK